MVYHVWKGVKMKTNKGKDDTKKPKRINFSKFKEASENQAQRDINNLSKSLQDISQNQALQEEIESKIIGLKELGYKYHLVNLNEIKVICESLYIRIRWEKDIKKFKIVEVKPYK